MVILMKILVWIAVGYLILYLFVPAGNFLYEGLRLPFWVVRLQKLVNPAIAKPEKIKYGGHFRQYFLYFPPVVGTADKQHVVIYIHGSGWQFSRPEMFAANGQWLAERGYHAFFLSHRRIPQCDIRELRTDTALGIKAVLGKMAALGIAQKKIILSGNSAGGNLCALAMFDQTVMGEVGLSPTVFSALALFAAPLDLSTMWPSPPLLMVTRMKKPALMRLANPICHLETAAKLPILLIHGDADGIVEYQNSVAFYEKLWALGTEQVQFETLGQAMHLDSASWCFEGHPSCVIYEEWLQRLENQAVEISL